MLLEPRLANLLKWANKRRQHRFINDPALGFLFLREFNDPEKATCRESLSLCILFQKLWL